MEQAKGRIHAVTCACAHMERSSEMRCFLVVAMLLAACSFLSHAAFAQDINRWDNWEDHLIAHPQMILGDLENAVAAKDRGALAGLIHPEFLQIYVADEPLMAVPVNTDRAAFINGWTTIWDGHPDLATSLVIDADACQTRQIGTDTWALAGIITNVRVGDMPAVRQTGELEVRRVDERFVMAKWTVHLSSKPPDQPKPSSTFGTIKSIYR